MPAVWSDPCFARERLRIRQSREVAQIARVRLSLAVSIGHDLDPPSGCRFDLSPLATHQRHHRSIRTDLQTLGSGWSDRTLTFESLEFRGLHRHVCRADLSV